MFYPFEVSDPFSSVVYRLSDTRLAELSLAPIEPEWNPGRAIAASPDPVWASSYGNAPIETTAAVSSALQDLVLASHTLRIPDISAVAEGRAKRHLMALVHLWRTLGDALPEGLGVARHVLELPPGQFLDPLPVVAGSLDALAPDAMRALYLRLEREFGVVAPVPRLPRGAEGSVLRGLQEGIARKTLQSMPADSSLNFYGLRDVAECAEFAAARARSLIEAGCLPRDIAVMTSGESRRLADAFRCQGISLSGLPAEEAERDTVGETLLFLLLTKRAPTTAMALASLCLSPIMPWPAQVGRDLAEEIMGGDFRAFPLQDSPTFVALWDDIRATAGSLAQLRFLLDRICDRLPSGRAIREKMQPIQGLLAGEGTPDWEAIIRAVHIDSPRFGDPLRNLEGVSLWVSYERPWRECRHLIVADFTEGMYPLHPRANPLFLDSEIEQISLATGLQLRGRAAGLAHGLRLFDQQLQAVGESVTFLTPFRDLMGSRLAPPAALSLVARAIADVKDARQLICDLSKIPPDEWPVAHYSERELPDAQPLAPVLSIKERDLLSLRLSDEGEALPQSPSRLESLIVSPLAWLLDEIGASDMSWSAESLDVITKGTLAHDVFEHTFLPGVEMLSEAELLAALPPAFDEAVNRHARFLRASSWEMERSGLQREITEAALRWREHLIQLGAKVIGNEVWLHAEVHGIRLRGKADVILELPDGSLMVVDHKKSGTAGRQRRMEAGWDLQAGLYREMLLRPIRREGDGLDALIGRSVGMGYHLMNDGGLLTCGVTLPSNSTALEIGALANVEAVAFLTKRLTEVQAGQVVLNTTNDAAFFKNNGGFTPYALERSSLVSAFMIVSGAKNDD